MCPRDSEQAHKWDSTATWELDAPGGPDREKSPLETQSGSSGNVAGLYSLVTRKSFFLLLKEPLGAKGTPRSAILFHVRRSSPLRFRLLTEPTVWRRYHYWCSPPTPVITWADLLGTHLDETLRSLYRSYSSSSSYSSSNFYFHRTLGRLLLPFKLDNLRLSHYFILATNFTS